MNDERDRLARVLDARAVARGANGFTVLQAEIVETLLRDLRERCGSVAGDCNDWVRRVPLVPVVEPPIDNPVLRVLRTPDLRE